MMTRRLKYLLIAREVLIERIIPNDQAFRFVCVEDPIPSDAKIEAIEMSITGTVRLLLSSDSFAEIGLDCAIPILAPIMQREIP